MALAEPYAPDAPLFALALADLPPLEDYFRRLRDVRLEITGNDVAELGLAESPRVGEVLAEVRRRKLNGELDGRDSELAAAQEADRGAVILRWEAPRTVRRRLLDARRAGSARAATPRSTSAC